MENFDTALMLLAVGMGTVFLVLLFVIYFSKLLVVIVNKWLPEEEASQPVARAAAAAGAVPANIVAAISAAVNTATGGKAKVDKIEKI